MGMCLCCLLVIFLTKTYLNTRCKQGLREPWNKIKGKKKNLLVTLSVAFVGSTAWNLSGLSSVDWFRLLWLPLQVSRGARNATASARLQALSTPKALSKDYIPPREPIWQPWGNKTDHKAVVSSTFIICSYCILSLSFPIRSLLIGWALFAFALVF